MLPCLHVQVDENIKLEDWMVDVDKKVRQLETGVQVQIDKDQHTDIRE